MSNKFICEMCNEEHESWCTEKELISCLPSYIREEVEINGSHDVCSDCFDKL